MLLRLRSGGSFFFSTKGPTTVLHGSGHHDVCHITRPQFLAFPSTVNTSFSAILRLTRGSNMAERAEEHTAWHLPWTIDITKPTVGSSYNVQWLIHDPKHWDKGIHISRCRPTGSKTATLGAPTEPDKQSFIIARLTKSSTLQRAHAWSHSLPSNTRQSRPAHQIVLICWFCRHSQLVGSGIDKIYCSKSLSHR